MENCAVRSLLLFSLQLQHREHVSRQRGKRVFGRRRARARGLAGNASAYERALAGVCECVYVCWGAGMCVGYSCMLALRRCVVSAKLC